MLAGYFFSAFLPSSFDCVFAAFGFLPDQEAVSL